MKKISEQNGTYFESDDETGNVRFLNEGEVFAHLNPKIIEWDRACEEIFASNQSLVVEFVQYLPALRTLRKEYRSPQLYITYLNQIEGVSDEAQDVVAQLVEVSTKAL